MRPAEFATALILAATSAAFLVVLTRLQPLGMDFALPRNSNVRVRFGALVGYALLVSPYAMNYELAFLALAIAGPMVPLLALGLGFLAGTPVLLIALLALVLRTCAETENRGAQPCKS